MDKDVDKLIAVIEAVADGNYSNEIMEFTKPEHDGMIRRLAEAVGMMMVQVEAREQRLELLIEELQQLNKQLKTNILSTVATIANALGARDNYTEGHAVRVAIYAERLAKRLGLSEAEVEDIKIGAILHDIGKIGFSDKLFTDLDLNSSTDLFDEIRKHPEIGVHILNNLDFLGSAVDYVYYHHERLDGSGYPVGLKGGEIPLGALIVSVADCFDAITSDRCYQKRRNVDQAFAILKELAGNGLPQDLVNQFIEEIKENGMIDGDKNIPQTSSEIHSWLLRF